MVCAGRRVPLRIGAPETLPGTTSTSAHPVQSIACFVMARRPSIPPYSIIPLELSSLSLAAQRMAAALRIEFGDRVVDGTVEVVGAGEGLVGEVMPLQVAPRSEEHTSELQSRQYLVCRLMLEKNEIEMRQPRLGHPAACLRSASCRSQRHFPGL